MDSLWSTNGLFESTTHDTIPQQLRTRITVPSLRTTWETASMVELAGRIGLQLIELGEPIFDLLFVLDELDAPVRETQPNEEMIHIVLGYELHWLNQILGDRAAPLAQTRNECTEDQGLIYTIQDDKQTVLVVTGTSPETTLLAARYLVTDGFGRGLEFHKGVIRISPSQAAIASEVVRNSTPMPCELSLHNLFTTDGIYTVQPGDIHPTLDVLFVIGGSSHEESVASVELATRLALSAGNLCFPLTRCQGEQASGTAPTISIIGHDDTGIQQQCVEIDDSDGIPNLKISGRRDRLIHFVREMIGEWFEPLDVLHQDTWRHRFAKLQSQSPDISHRAQLAMDAFQHIVQGKANELTIPAHLAEPLTLWNSHLQTADPATSIAMSVEHLSPAWTVNWNDPGELSDMDSFIFDALESRAKSEDASPSITIEVTTTVSHSTFSSWTADLHHRLCDTYDAEVTFVYRNANKSGLHWLMHEILPKLKRLRGIHGIELAARAFRPEMKHIDRPYRFLQELYPADALLAAELDIPLERIQLQLLDDPAAPMFQVSVFDVDGKQFRTWNWEGWADSVDYMPDRVDLGKVLVPVAGCRIYLEDQVDPFVSRGFKTNPFRFWCWYQTLIPTIQQREDLHAGAPKFMQLECHVTMDAQDEELGYLEEVNSCLEALHEDVYFYTLHAFYEHGREVNDTTWDAPGGILPFIHTEVGATPQASISLYTFPTTSELTVKSGEKTEVLRPVDPKTFRSVRIHKVVQENEATTFELSGFEDANVESMCAEWLTAATSLDRRNRNCISSNISEQEKSVDDEMLVNHDVTVWMEKNQRNIPGNVTRLDFSFQGEWIWLAELYAGGREGRISSPVKHALYKPTIYITARHHANEVSSTNAALQLITQIATDASLLEKLNLVIVPLENADGANLHHRMAEEHPKWKLHAARYNACGLEFQEYRFRPDATFGESRIYEKVWDRWKPDIAIDDHGIPSHEWIQPFSGYSSPPRFPVSYWVPSARMYTIWRQPEGNRSEYLDAYHSLRLHVTECLDQDDDVARDNAALLQTYRKWGNDFDQAYFPVELSNGSIAHTWDSHPSASSTNLIERFPDLVTADIITEVNDETVHGEELRACATAHLVVNRAVIEWTRNIDICCSISHTQMPSGRLCVQMHRRRPLQPN